MGTLILVVKIWSCHVCYCEDYSLLDVTPYGLVVYLLSPPVFISHPSLLSESAHANAVSYILPMKRSTVSLLCFLWLSSTSYWFMQNHYFSLTHSVFENRTFKGPHIHLLTPTGLQQGPMPFLPLPASVPLVSMLKLRKKRDLYIRLYVITTQKIVIFEILVTLIF
jgi:hypothetical protein